MNWKDIGKKVADTAPLLGKVLGGPAGGAAGELVANLLGTKPDPDEVMSQIAADPKAGLKLKELEINHQIQLGNLLLQHENSRLQDVQSARNRELELTRTTGKRDVNLYILAWTVITGFFVLMGIMIFATLPQDNIGPVNQLFGALSTGFGVVLQYFFGSSKSSADKTAMMKGKL